MRRTNPRWFQNIFLTFTLMSVFGLLIPAVALAGPVSQPLSGENALVFSVSVTSSSSGSGSSPRRVIYTISKDAMRIDASSKGEDRSYIWNLSTKTVASLNNANKTYHSDSLDKIMGFVDFSQLLGQYAGNNPKDKVVHGTSPRIIAGVSCTETTILHRFKGRVVGMINGDQKIVQCLASSFPGSDLYQTFQEGLASLTKKSVQGQAPPATLPRIAPLSLETVRTTDYSKGFLVKILSTLHLYDSSKIPVRQVERETVTDLSVHSVPSESFTIPAAFTKETAPAS